MEPGWWLRQRQATCDADAGQQTLQVEGGRVMIKGRTAATVLLGCAMATGCTRNLPPPALPERVIPQVPAEIGPPAQNEGRVVIDTVGGPARVIENVAAVQTWGYRALVVAPVCNTPCAVNLPLGPHELVFESPVDSDRTSTGTINVGTRPSIYRHVMAEHHSNMAGRIPGYVGLGVGGAALLASAFWLMVNALEGSIASTDAERASVDSSNTAALATGGVGLGVLAVGAVLLAIFRPEHREGVGLQWTPQPQGTVIP
jgi:hypothetical protein